MPLIAFSSPKGGVGKTTLAAHVAAILRGRGHAVLALDMDPQNALRLHLGLPISFEGGFMCHLAQSRDWRGDVVKTPSGVDLLPYGAVDPRRATDLSARLNAEPELLAAPVREMLAQPNLIVVLDTPPGPTAAMDALLPLMDLVCLVLLADAGSAAMLPMVANGQVFGRGTLAGRFAERAGVVINQVQPGAPLSETVMECAIRALGDRLLGVVCQDVALGEALAQKRLLTAGGGKAADDLMLLADQITTRLRLPPPGPSLQAAPSGYPALAEWGLR